MIFRSDNDMLITISRANYTSDMEYYKHIMNLITPPTTQKTNTSTAEQYASLRSISKVVPLDKDLKYYNKL